MKHPTTFPYAFQLINWFTKVSKWKYHMHKLISQYALLMFHHKNTSHKWNWFENNIISNWKDIPKLENHLFHNPLQMG